MPEASGQLWYRKCGGSCGAACADFRWSSECSAEMASTAAPATSAPAHALSLEQLRRLAAELRLLAAQVRGECVLWRGYDRAAGDGEGATGRVGAAHHLSSRHRGLPPYTLQSAKPGKPPRSSIGRGFGEDSVSAAPVWGPFVHPTLLPAPLPATSLRW